MESMRGGGRGLRKYQIAVVETPMKAIAPTSSIHFRKCFALGLGRPRLNRPRKCCALYARCAAAIGHWILLRRRYARDEPVAAPGQGFNEFRRIGLVAEYFAESADAVVEDVFEVHQGVVGPELLLQSLPFDQIAGGVAPEWPVHQRAGRGA